MCETILVVREFDRFSQILTERDFEVINLPLIQTVPVENFDELDRKITELDDYDGLFFTSPKAAKVFLQRYNRQEIRFRGKVYVLGERAAGIFEKSDFKIVYRSDANTAGDLIKSFDKKDFAAKNFLFVRGDKSLRAIFELLRDSAQIDEIIVYRTIENAIDEKLFAEINEKFHQRIIDWICFFSPSGVESFIKKFGAESLEKVKITVIGATTAKKLIDENLKVDFVAAKANAESFAAELIEYLGEINTGEHR